MRHYHADACVACISWYLSSLFTHITPHISHITPHTLSEVRREGAGGVGLQGQPKHSNRTNSRQNSTISHNMMMLSVMCLSPASQSSRFVISIDVCPKLCVSFLFHLFFRLQETTLDTAHTVQQTSESPAVKQESICMAECKYSRIHLHHSFCVATQPEDQQAIQSRMSCLKTIFLSSSVLFACVIVNYTQ